MSELSWTSDIGNFVKKDEIDENNCSSDVDAHFSRFGRGDWVHFSFGKKLWSAQSVNNSEIQKYKLFVNMLYGIDED
jgi:hypothetical protein